MKEFLKNNKVTYNLMSFTGYKSLLIFSLLSEGPKSYNEICDYFYNNPYLREKISIDTLRVYINSLKRIGCEIKRFRDENKESKYQIVEHPFEIKLSEEEKQSIIKIYKNIIKNIDINDLISLDNLLEKIGLYIKDEDFKGTIKKLSMLRDIDKSLLSDILDCCAKKEQIVISYSSPNSGEKDIEIIADKVDVSNNKIYLYGIGFEYNQYGSFLVSRIKQLKEIKFNKTIPVNIEKTTIIYEINNTNIEPELKQNERILEKKDDKVTIEMTTSNIFLARQRLLEYGPQCKILSPQDFKNDFVKLLKDMKAEYYFD